MSITDALSNFSKKLSRFEEAESVVFVRPESKDKELQKKINLSEEEKIEKIRSEYEKYLKVNPLPSSGDNTPSDARDVP